MSATGPDNPQPENTPPVSPPAASKLPPSDVWDQVELPHDLAGLPRVGEMISDGAESSLAMRRPDLSGPQPSTAPRRVSATQTNFLLLSVQSGPHQGEGRIVKTGQSMVVGRAADVQLRLINELSLSRHHFQIESRSPGWYLVDLNSTNGTLVNGAKVDQVELKHGDRIECGETIFNVGIANKLVDDDDITVQITMPAPSPADPEPTHRITPKPKPQ